MIDFQLTPHDEKVLAAARAQALVCRQHARYFDEHEEEMPPDSLPEAATYTDPTKLFAERCPEDTCDAVMRMLLGMASSWGDSTVRFRHRAGGLGNAALGAAGTPAQIQQWNGKTLAMAITEPGCGSDTSAIRTTATLEGDEWVLSGEKIFVTTGIRADGVVVWATVDKAAGRAGIKSFVVPREAPGFKVVKKEKKLGIRGSDTATILLDKCRIPRDHLLGTDEKIPHQGSGGYSRVLKTFNITRPGVAAGGIGVAQACVDFVRDALAEAGHEVPWGASLASRTAIEQKLLEIEADLEAAILVTCHAAWLAQRGENNNTEASVAKAKGGEVARTIPQRCIELMGAMGISRATLLEKWLRDARITDIYEGTGQIQRLIIARAILGYGSKELR